jgi:predicted nucleic acid-binding protein
VTAPATALRAAYLDSSALVKLVVPEPETLALRTAIVDENWQLLVTSALAHTEVLRAVAVAAPSAAVERRARAVLATVVQLDISADVLDRAATLRPVTVRSLDAIHIATATLASNERYPQVPNGIVALVTYDARMASAWYRSSPTSVRAPGAPLDRPV